METSFKNTNNKIYANKASPSTVINSKLSCSQISQNKDLSTRQTNASIQTHSSKNMSDLYVAASFADEDAEAMSFQMSRTPMILDPNVTAVDLSESEEDSDSDTGIEEGECSEEEAPAPMKDTDSTIDIPRTKNETISLPVSKVDVELGSDSPIEKVGSILNINRQQCVVTIQSEISKPPLVEDSILCFQDRSILGRIHEVFGPVTRPFYIVRFENPEELPIDITEHTDVFYATKHSSFVKCEELHSKGSDASNIYDEEPGAHEIEYSDDEAEAASKREKRKRNPTSAKKTKKSGRNESQHRQRGRNQNHSSISQGPGRNEYSTMPLMHPYQPFGVPQYQMGNVNYPCPSPPGPSFLPRYPAPYYPIPQQSYNNQSNLYYSHHPHQGAPRSFFNYYNGESMGYINTYHDRGQNNTFQPPLPKEK